MFTDIFIPVVCFVGKLASRIWLIILQGDDNMASNSKYSVTIFLFIYAGSCALVDF